MLSSSDSLSLSFFASDKFKDLDPSRKWIGSLPLILCSLHLCFLNTTKGSTLSPSYIIPCSIASHHKDKVKELWMPPATTFSPALSSPTTIIPLPHNKSVSEGRRLTVSDEQQMFHPAFLPQLIYHLLSLIPFSGSPVIWQGGVVFKTANGQCLVGLYMRGAFIEDKIQQRMANRRHGEPERLQTLGIFVKQQQRPQSESSQGREVSELMSTVLGSVESVTREFWRSLRWQTDAPSCLCGSILLDPAQKEAHFISSRSNHHCKCAIISFHFVE